MENVNIFPRSNSYPFETFKLKRNRIGNKNDFNINYKIEKDKKKNNSFNKSKNLNDNKYFSAQLSNLNNSIDKEHMDQPELDNFNIEFFLPNILQKNLEEINIENKSNKDNINNIAELINQKDINFNNNYLKNDINTNKEKESKISKNINNFSMSLGNLYEKKIDNSYQNVNNLSMGNNEFFNMQNNMTIPPQNRNYINSKIYNKKEMFNNSIDLNNNYPFNINNNNLNNINFFHPEYNQNLFQFNNKNMYFLPQNNPKIIYGNNCFNYLYLNENNLINPINQFNFNANQMNTLNYEKPYFNYNNASTKNYSKKIIDDYTLEMFGRRGWICQSCNNFNYETRKKCNRCQIIKAAKKVTIERNLFSEGKNNINHKFDWFCKYCGNYNYSFRKICNRCQKEKCI